MHIHIYIHTHIYVHTYIHIHTILLHKPSCALQAQHLTPTSIGSDIVHEMRTYPYVVKHYIYGFTTHGHIYISIAPACSVSRPTVC